MPTFVAMPVKGSAGSNRCVIFSRCIKLCFGLCFGLFTMLPGAAAQSIAPADVGAGNSATAAPVPRQAGSPRVGEATTALLDLQVSGRAAAPVLPMLGAAATLSWQRYLDSFRQPIPVSFGHAVAKNAGGK